MCETHLALRTRPEVTAAELHGNPTYATSYSSLVVTCDMNLKKGAVYLSSELGHMEHHPLKQLHSHDTTENEGSYLNLYPDYWLRFLLVRTVWSHYV